MVTRHLSPAPSSTYEAAAKIPRVTPIGALSTVLRMPNSAAPPRIMTARHPRAVGTYGPAAIEWANDRVRMHKRNVPRLRWWQRLVLCRALECDAKGRLVWSTIVQSGPRQTGKSVIERVVCGWRQHMSELFGEPQDVLHLAHKLTAAREVWAPAARFMGATYGPGCVRSTNGEECITVEDGSRWLIQAANDGAGVSFTLSLVLVDEAWRVPRGIVDNGLVPTMADVEQPQLWLVSTAGTSTSDLMRVNRDHAIAELRPDRHSSTLIVEWSTPEGEDVDIGDPAVWRAVSPHWDDNRATAIRKAYSMADDPAGELAFRQQWLNQWVPTLVAPMFDVSMVDAATIEGGRSIGPVAFGFDVAPDRSHAAVLAIADGVVEVVATPTPAAACARVLLDLATSHDLVGIGYDAGGPGASVADELSESLVADLLVPVNGREMTAACGQLFDRLTTGQASVRADPVLDEALRGAARRPYGQSWAFRRDGAVSGVPLLAAAAALWASEHPREVEAEEPQIWV